MIDWNEPQVKLAVYLIYGTSFIVMFFAIMIWRNRVSHIELMNDFEYLAVFGLLHGLAEYSDIPRFLAWQPSWAYDLVKLVLVSGSFAALFAFGLSVISAGIEERRWMRGIPYGAIAMYFWLLAFVGLDTVYGEGKGISYALADLAQRHSLGFLGAFVTSYAFLELSGKMNSIIGTKAGRRFMYAGISFALYAVFGGIIVTPFLGVPAVVYRSVIALMITVTVIRIFHMFKINPVG